MASSWPTGALSRDIVIDALRALRAGLVLGDDDDGADVLRDAMRALRGAATATHETPGATVVRLPVQGRKG